MKNINITINDTDTRENVKNQLNEYRFGRNHIVTLTICISDTYVLLDDALREIKGHPDVVDFREMELVSKEIKKMAESLLDNIKNLNLKLTRIFIVVNKILDPEVRKVIMDHYFMNNTLQAITLDMDVSERKIKYLHHAGLDYLATKM